MFILRDILTPLQQEFKHSRKGTERGVWFIYTLLAVITHSPHPVPQTCYDA